MKEWMLPIAIGLGAASYLAYHFMPEPVHRIGPVLSDIVAVAQPLMLFAMLFFTFCRIEPRQLMPHRWHWPLLLFQGLSFVLLGFLIVLLKRLLSDGFEDWIVPIEGFMLCLICPTATAAAVVTGKLGGDIPGITTYTILINLLVAILVPAVVPMVHPQEGVTFWVAFSMILAKVFPLLILPCFAAWLTRYLLPKVHAWLIAHPDLPFQIWAVSLALAIAVTVKAIVHSELSFLLMSLIAFFSLLSCILQFAFGRWVGRLYGHKKGRHDKQITAGQALGQKNTVFAIWMGYTFMTPESSMAGGFYSIWHNIYNSWQLHRHDHS